MQINSIHLVLENNKLFIPCRVGLVVGVSGSHTVGREFASRPGHTKDHRKNGTNCLPAWHACVRVEFGSAARLSKKARLCVELSMGTCT